MKKQLSVCCLWLGLWIAVAVSAQEASVVQEGKGTSDVYIGEPADAVAMRLGAPTEALYGFIVIYKRPDGSQLSYRLDGKVIASINFTGGPGAAYETKAGARFGMSRQQIEQLYGAPDAEVANKIFYNRRGIGFFFTDGMVTEFAIFAPR